MNLSAVDEATRSNMEESSGNKEIEVNSNFTFDGKCNPANKLNKSSKGLAQAYNSKRLLYDSDDEESKHDLRNNSTERRPFLFDSLLFNADNEKQLKGNSLHNSGKNYFLGKQQKKRIRWGSEGDNSDSSDDYSGLQNIFEKEAKTSRPTVQFGMLAK